MADETLLYTASFDPTGIIQGEAVAAKAFNDLDKTAAKAFNGMSESASRATAPLNNVKESSKALEWQVKQAGFQVGDFFVQLASGQGVIRPLIQQSNQLIAGLGMWGSVIGAGVAILGSLYVALSNTKDATKELSTTELPEWMQTPGNLHAVIEAMRDFKDTQKEVSNGLLEMGAPLSSMGEMTDAYTLSMQRAVKAEDDFKKAVGLTINEFKIKITQFVDFNQYVADAQARANAKFLDIQDENAQERVKSKKAELDRLLSMEDIAYDKSIRSTRAYYSAIRDDITKSDTERKAAKKNLFDALGIIEDTHNQRRTNITEQVTTKEAEKTKEKNKQAAAEAKREREKQEREAEQTFRAMVTAHEKEVAELRTYQAAKADITADLDIRSVEAGGDDVAKLEARQARERQALQKRLDDQIKNLDLSIKEYEEYYSALDRLAEIHAVERQKIVKDETDKDKKRLSDAAKDAARAWESLGATIADTFNIGPLKTFLTWLERIVSVAEDLATIKRTSSILGSLFGAGAAGTIAGFAGGAEGPGVLAIVGALAKNSQSNVPSSDYTPPGALAKGNGTQQGQASQSSITVGDVHVHVPAGTPVASMGGVIKLAVVEAAEQIERNRNQKTFTNGTFHF